MADDSILVLKPSSFYFLWQYGFLMLPGGLIGGLLLWLALGISGVPPLGEAIEISIGLVLLGSTAWPIVFAIGARVVISEESIAKVYPLRLRRRAVFRRDLERIEREQATARTDPLLGGTALLKWFVLRFRDRDGRVVFTLGSNFWGSATLERIIATLGDGDRPSM